MRCAYNIVFGRLALGANDAQVEGFGSVDGGMGAMGFLGRSVYCLVYANFRNRQECLYYFSRLDPGAKKAAR